MSDARQPDGDANKLPTDLEDEVLAALEQDDATRDTVIAQILVREPEHASEIRRWLQASGAMPAANAPSTSPSPQTLIGPWRVLRLLGRGGFGSVYLAEPATGGATVAVKVLRDDLSTRDVLRRFEKEREALQRLDHPGIARHVGAGQTEGGKPWFAMEYVPGGTLLAHCRRLSMPIRARVGIFLRALDAVAHAHQRGILHRDLSANNVLVSGDGEDAQPKIIDFGVAKSLDAPLLDGGSFTFQGTLMGTPEYMSPEQASGMLGAIDTRTDVYSLGVQLYELLTDQLPIPSEQLRAQGPAGIADVLRSHEPEPPSAVAPPRVRRALRGDLDSIVMRAIAKDRDERYGSAAEFAADLRRSLANEPVLAAKTNAWYLLRKYARRHRARFAFAAAATALVLGATLVSAYQWNEARNARSELANALDVLAMESEKGFRLLAAQQRLLRGIEEEPSLVPAWPNRIDAMRRWLADYEAPLRSALMELRPDDSPSTSRTPATAEATHGVDLAQALLRIEKEIGAFVSPSGAAARVQRRLRFAEERVAPALLRDADAWRAAAVELQRSASSLPPQPGLVPLGKDPNTGLFEFLDLATHDENAPLPTRGTDGRIAIEEGTGIVFVLLPRATMRLGAQRSEQGMERFDADAENNELRGESTMLDEFFIAKTELTRAQWARLVAIPIEGRGNLPQTEIDWDEACAALRAFGMDLPTEAQWEHSCRAGSTTPWWTGTSLESLGAAAQFGSALAPVAQLQSNAFGLFDVHGNAAEWCRDLQFGYDQAQLRARDGLLTAPSSVRAPDLRSVRGGSAQGGPKAARCSARAGRIPAAKDPWIGLRPVRALVRG